MEYKVVDSQSLGHHKNYKYSNFRTYMNRWYEQITQWIVHYRHKKKQGQLSGNLLGNSAWIKWILSLGRGRSMMNDVLSETSVEELKYHCIYFFKADNFSELAYHSKETHLNVFEMCVPSVF